MRPLGMKQKMWTGGLGAAVGGWVIDALENIGPDIPVGVEEAIIGILVALAIWLVPNK